MRGVSEKRHSYRDIDRNLLFLKVYVIILVILFFILAYKGEKDAYQGYYLAFDDDEEFVEPRIVSKEPFYEEEKGDKLPEEIPEAELPNEDTELKDLHLEPSTGEQDPVKVSISRKEFDKMELRIDKGSSIKWLNNDSRIHKIACYKEENRIYTDKNLEKGEYSQYTFEESGEFLCIDAIFGIRQKINVV